MSCAIAIDTSGRVRAGRYSALVLLYARDDGQHEMRVARTGCGDGSDGLLRADTWYQLDESGEFVEASIND